MFKKFLCFVLILSLLLSISTFVLAQNNTGEKMSADYIFADALNDYNKKNYNQAAEKFNSLLNRNNLSEELEFSVLYYSTMTAVRRYQTREAINYLESFNQAGFQNGNLNWQIGQLFLNKEGQFDSANFNQALTYLKEAEKLGLKKLPFKRDLAYAHLENQELKEAEEIYQEIIKNNAVSADYLNLARIKENQNQPNQAIEYYETARELNGSQSSLYLNLGNLYQKLDNYDAALLIFKEAVKTRTDFAPFYIGLGESYIKLENYSEAEKALKKAVEINQNSYYGYYLLGNLAKEKENYNQALKYYEQSLKNNQNYVKTYLAQGRLHMERKEYYQAISRFSLAVEKNPDYAESHYYLGEAYYRAGMIEAAAAEFRKTLHINDRFPQAREILDKIEEELKVN